MNKNLKKLLSNKRKLKKELESFIEDNKVKIDDISPEEIKDLVDSIKEEDIDYDKLQELVNKMK